jgi:hypothetical protein
MRNNKSVDYNSIEKNRNFEIYTQNLMLLRKSKNKRLQRAECAFGMVQ